MPSSMAWGKTSNTEELAAGKSHAVPGIFVLWWDLT